MSPSWHEIVAIALCSLIFLSDFHFQNVETSESPSLTSLTRTLGSVIQRLIS